MAKSKNENEFGFSSASIVKLSPKLYSAFGAARSRKKALDPYCQYIRSEVRKLVPGEVIVVSLELFRVEKASSLYFTGSLKRDRQKLKQSVWTSLRRIVKGKYLEEPKKYYSVKYMDELIGVAVPEAKRGDVIIRPIQELPPRSKLPNCRVKVKKEG